MEPEKKSNGAILGSIIIIIILVVGGIYLLNNSKTETQPNDSEELLDPSANSAASIEAELENLDLETLDSEI